jgi:hypothetical protein
VLLDRSRSAAADSRIYEDAVRRVLKGVKPGDRFVMAAITATSGDDFRVSVDRSLPSSLPAQGFLDEPRKYQADLKIRESEVAERTKAIFDDAEAFLKVKSSANKSALFESLLVVSPLLKAEERRKVLLVLSDMMEDSAGVSFERNPPTDASTKRTLENQQKVHTLPDLSGVAICVAGAVASPPERAAAVERFWRAYFAATGAIVRPGAYARTLTGCVEP